MILQWKRVAKFSIKLFGLLKLAYARLKYYNRKYPPSFKIPKYGEISFSLCSLLCDFFKNVALLITHSIFIALAGKKKCRPHLLRVNEGVKKCTMRQGPGRLQEGIFTSGVYIFHEETEERGFSFAVSPYSNQLLKFKHKITLRGWVIIIFWLVNLSNIRFILQ